ncbi:MAG: right-handed parallel beta-helix repeat-containing protein [Verrucomicrobia bacterium]|nr:right-handed parallel beta-helix repeat-containing protein [Verrucomicrobiota bacterium]
MIRQSVLVLVVVLLGLGARLGAEAFEPSKTPPVIVGEGRDAGIFVMSHKAVPARTTETVLPPAAQGDPAASGLHYYVDIPTLVVIYTDYYHTPDCQMHLTSADIAVLQAEVEKTRLFNWRSSHMKCNMAIDYLIIGDDPGERTLTPDMMWEFTPGEGNYWMPWWSCDGSTSVQQDLYDAGVVDGQYSVVMVLYAFQNCDTAWAAIGGGTYGPAEFGGGFMDDAAYIANPLAWGLEAEDVCIHEYLHALDAIYELSGNPVGSNPHHADQPSTFPYPKDCGLDFNYQINNVLDPASWLALFPQWATDRSTTDSDNDGVPNGGDLPITEATLGTNYLDQDTDDDGLSDLAETMATYYAMSDLFNPDTDGDGVLDGEDPYPLFACSEHVIKGVPITDGVIEPGEYAEIIRYNESDLNHSAVVYGRWTNGVLFLAADITDDMLSTYYDEPWWCDNFEIQIDAQEDGWFFAGTQNYRFLIVPRGLDGVPDVYGHAYYDDPGNDPYHAIDTSAVSARFSYTATGYVVEVAIPESVMPGVDVESDATLRATFFVEDYDTWPGWPRYNIMTERDDDIPGFVLFSFSEAAHYYVNALTGDDDNDGQAAEWDGLHGPKQTIQAMVDAATAPAIIHVAPGTYHESVEMASNIAILGSGADRTLIDSDGLTNRHPQGLGEAVFCSGVTGVTVDGFTLTTRDINDTALRSINSTVTVRNCVATGSVSGFGVGQTGSATLVNCLPYGNLRGIWQSGEAGLTVRNCTLVDNSQVGLVRWGTGAVTLTDSILWGNGDDLSASSITVGYCDIGDGDFAGTNGNILQDPLFVAGLLHDYYLSHMTSGQPTTSPCVDAGSTTALDAGLDGLTTRTDGVGDTGQVDMGYHAPYVPHITSIELTGGMVQIQWNARPGASYAVEWSDNCVDWHEVPVGETGTWTDVDSPLYTEKRYRVREQ